MSEELEVCPFCGGHARDQHRNEDHYQYGWIECVSCGAKSNTGSTKQKVTDAWNARQTNKLLEMAAGALKFVRDIEKPSCKPLEASAWRITSEQQSEIAGDALLTLQQHGFGKD